MLSVRRAQSRTAAEGVCGLDVNQSLSQPPKCIQLMPHVVPELTKLQEASYIGVRQTWSLELAHGTTLRWRNRLFSCSWKPVRRNSYYPVRTPRLEDTLLNTHACELITILTQRCLSVLRSSCRWSKSVRHPKCALIFLKICRER